MQESKNCNPELSIVTSRTIILIFCLISSSSFAEDRKWYLDLGYGISEVDSEFEYVATSDPSAVAIAASGFPRTQLIRLSYLSPFESDENVSITIGRFLGEKWGLELSYLNFGHMSSEVIFTHEEVPYGGRNSSIDIDGVNVALFGEQPLSSKWSLIGKLGVYFFDSDSGDSFFENQVVEAPSCNTLPDGSPCFRQIPFKGPIRFPSFTTPIVHTVADSLIAMRNPEARSVGNGQRINTSVGVRYKINDKYSVKFDYSYFDDIDHTDLEMLRLSFSLSF